MGFSMLPFTFVFTMELRCHRMIRLLNEADRWFSLLQKMI